MTRKPRAVHVATITKKAKGRVYQSHLLRRTYREDGKVKHQTLGNLSDLPPDAIDYVRRRLRGEPPADGDAFEILRSLPHGHVAAVLGTLRTIGLENVLGSKRSRERDLVVAMTVARIENKLARKHLVGRLLVLYDVSSSYYTGRRSSLVEFGSSHDRKKGFPQIVYGLLCNADGCPVSIEVFAGRVPTPVGAADPATLSAQIAKVRKRFGIERVVLVGDRGMITSKRIEEELRDVDGLDWITALRSDGIRKLVSQGAIQMSLFDEKDLAEVTSPDFPGERLIVCRNPRLADERARKRNELLEATDKKLDAIVTAVNRRSRPLRGRDTIGLRVGKVLHPFQVGKHFDLTIEDDSFSYQRREAKIAEETALDGLYVVRTSVEPELIGSEQTVRTYKSLSQVERAFRSLKTVDLQLRPIYHWKDDRIKAHVFLCLLAYYVEWHMRGCLAELLFDDHDRNAAEQTRGSIVAPAPRSDAAQRKDRTQRNSDDLPVQSFRSLLKDLGTLCRNHVRTGELEYTVLTTPTALQTRALTLLGVGLTT